MSWSNIPKADAIWNGETPESYMLGTFLAVFVMTAIGLAGFMANDNTNTAED